MSDVWGELEEWLKQKAKSLNELVENSEKFQCFLEHLASYRDADLLKAWRTLFKDNKWVRLEDVKEAIQQLKQKYVLVEKEKLEELISIYSNELPETVAIVSDLKELLKE